MTILNLKVFLKKYNKNFTVTEIVSKLVYNYSTYSRDSIKKKQTMDYLILITAAWEKLKGHVFT